MQVTGNETCIYSGKGFAHNSHIGNWVKMKDQSQLSVK